MIVKTPIIPVEQTFAKLAGAKEINKEAICVFAATGFFLDMDTYWKNKVVLPAASICTLDNDGILVKHKPWFKWHHSPRDISFEEALDEFSNLFEQIIKEQTNNKPVILPLSGGLDSRTQAVALKKIEAKVQAYSYEFLGGYAETKIANSIAFACDFPFQKLQIPKGYLWNVIDELAVINNCYSDFCSPRQMAVLPQLKQLQGAFSLGHWGDVLFDGMRVSSNLSLEAQMEIILKKIVKKGGFSLAQDLWESWQLSGSFQDYFYQRIYSLLKKIDIPQDANAQIRAFKSLYWAPRWTSINLAVFKNEHAINLPYYNNKICEFICNIPEAYLANRRLQIAYIKKQNPLLAAITWQDHKPFNLYNYKKNKLPLNLPYRLVNKCKRVLNHTIGKPYIQRNWELQFLGKANMANLEKHLLSNKFSKLVPKYLTEEYIQKFKTENPINTAHAINMLLVLQMWNKNNKLNG